jgi:hypothetical protein
MLQLLNTYLLLWRIGWYHLLAGSLVEREVEHLSDVNRCLRILIEGDRPTLPLSMWPKVLKSECHLLLSTKRNGTGILVKK